MDYVAYLEEYFTGFTVTSELNFQYGGSGTVFVVKNLGGGQNYLDSLIQPVQIVAHTDDVDAAYTLLSTFAQTKSGTFFIQDLEYIRQAYSTPMVLSSFNGMSPNHTSQIIVNGTLIVSTNLSDISKVEIDDFEYFTVNRKLAYVTKEDTQPDTDRLSDTNISVGMLSFQVSMEHKDNDVCVKARRIREGNLSVDNSFTIKLTFSDNDYVETYTMKLTSYTIDSNNSLSPVVVMTFAR